MTLAHDIVHNSYSGLGYGNGLSLFKTFTGDENLDMLRVENPAARRSSSASTSAATTR